MNQFLRGVMTAAASSFTLPEPIMEIGSYQVEGQSELVNLRSLFPGKQYIGVDFREGPGVDCVANVEALPHKDQSIGTVIALSTFEHVQRFWLGFSEVERVLRPDGVFVVAVPFNFRVHAFPNDYWRFTPEALDFLLEKFPMRLIGWHGADRRMANVWGVAFKNDKNLPTKQDIERYKEQLKAHAHEPMPWHTKLRYRLGRVLCGPRPFATYLDQNCWSLETRGHGAFDSTALASSHLTGGL